MDFKSINFFGAAGGGDFGDTGQDEGARFRNLEIDDDPPTLAPLTPAQPLAPPPRISGADTGAMRTSATGAARVPTRNAVAVPPLAVAAVLAGAKPAPEALPAALASQETDTAQTHGDIDTEGRARAIASGLVAHKHGLIPNEATFFSWGTRGQWGDKARKARLELAARPLIGELVKSVCATVGAEQRHQAPRVLTGLTYGADDHLRPEGQTTGGARMTARAFAQLLGRAGAAPYAATYLGHESMPAEMRAEHVRHWLTEAVDTKQVQRKGERVPRTVTVPRDAVLLTKLDTEGRRYIYGVVSDSYTRYDLDAAIGDIAKAVPAESRGALAYNPESTRWRVDVSLGAEFEPVVGDIHRVTMRVKSSDAGGGSVTVELFAERARCLNFSKIKLRGKAARVRHTGDSVADKVRALLDVKAEALRDFSAVWAEANQTALIGEALAGDGEARDVFRALIKAGHLPAPDGEDAAVAHYFNAWLKEPGHTRADFVNAATRAAHEAPWSSPWASETIEDQAGELLYNQLVINPAWRQEASA